PCFYDEFLNFSNRYFSKKYTIEYLKTHLKHIYDFALSYKPVKIFPTYFLFTSKGIFLNYSCIDLPTDEYVLPELIAPTAQPPQPSNILSYPNSTDTPIQLHPEDSKSTANTTTVNPLVEEVNIDEAPILDLDEDSNSDALVAEMSRAVARSKVREARLKARIARLKAERSTEKYLAKYGASYSDLDDSETETEAETSSADETSGDEQ
ncbi:MAG: hypothetical protein EB120_13300, partial [Proteobacteria bacterium]|nr:hypothetical protein [Pseudomonadota bacterium]